MNKIFNFLASGFYISLLPAHILKGHKNTGAGFLGTLVAVPFVFLLPADWRAQLVFAATFSLFAVWVVSKSTFEGHDSPKIVIDEMAGYFCAVACLPRTGGFLLAAFILFRLFDWLKPFFIKKFDNMHNAAGVVLDDVAAGICANIILQLVSATGFLW
jgi:phosphatidylglycerophosphatase A